MMLEDEDYLDAVKGIIETQGATAGGSSNSHTAILARTMNIPALIGVDFDESWDGKLAVLDGYNHCVYIDPAQALLAAMEEKLKCDLKQEALLQGLKKKPNVTLDGREIKVYANIGNAGDVGLVLQNDAQGIGLFRSEFIYLDSQDYPTEDQQFMLYKRVAETMAGKKVIIRTLDIGADKQADYFQLDNFYDPHHPAVLRMIKHTVEAGHRHGCWVGVCGELGADPTLTETFLRMGLDELSVSPSTVLPIRKLIRSLDLSQD